MEKRLAHLLLDVAQVEKGDQGAGIGALGVEGVGIAEDDDVLVFVGLESIEGRRSVVSPSWNLISMFLQPTQTCVNLILSHAAQVGY